MKNLIKQYGLYAAWGVAALAVIGSLYFSEFLDLPPCVLCWYQRAMMYPMAIILLIGMIRKDLKVWVYALPLSIIGLLVAIYHNLLYFKILPESAAPCVAGISCTTQFLQFFGFIDIPLMSLIAFVVITALLSAYAWIQKHD
ncbi:MAG: disulfide bond formation protein B [Candidatus Doudnabacteria bacterium]|nr:disulfide bond formation protein B [Candidatus Doudnabacteria bacterium]